MPAGTPHPPHHIWASALYITGRTSPLWRDTGHRADYPDTPRDERRWALLECEDVEAALADIRRAGHRAMAFGGVDAGTWGLPRRLPQYSWEADGLLEHASDLTPVEMAQAAMALLDQAGLSVRNQDLVRMHIEQHVFEGDAQPFSAEEGWVEEVRRVA